MKLLLTQHIYLLDPSGRHDVRGKVCGEHVDLPQHSLLNLSKRLDKRVSHVVGHRGSRKCGTEAEVNKPSVSSINKLFDILKEQLTS